MALKLRPPRAGKSPNWTIRGTYLGVAVEQSSGTHKRSVARKLADDLEEAIERGEYPTHQAAPGVAPATFLSAAVAYLEAGGSRRFLSPLIKHFGDTPIDRVDQAAIEAAAAALYPNRTPATRNRCVFTPVSAVLHHVDAEIKLRRPKGARGKIKTDFLWPADAFAIIAAADVVAADFGLLLRLFLYTGMRKSEALGLLKDDVRIAEREAWVRRSKNDDPRMLRLRDDLCALLKAHITTAPGPRLFRFRDGGNFKHLLVRAKLAACELPCPARRPVGWKAPAHRLAWVTFHTFRHTWATWMRRDGGADLQGLVATGNWRDPRSAARYAHAVSRDEWDRVEQLPAMPKPGKKRQRKMA